MSNQKGRQTATAKWTPTLRWLAILGGGAAVAIYYTLLLANGHLQPIGPEVHDAVFGNMLHHLLQGRFDVDPAAIGAEAFTRDGITYTYFGIGPAVLRLLAMPFADVETGGLARPSCLVAMLIYVAVLVRTLFLVHAAVPADKRSTTLLAIMVVALTLSGPQLYLLGSAWVFHEPVFWAGAIGAIYNLILLRRVVRDQRLTAGDLALMAVCAGTALNTRASVGAGLMVATGLLVLWTAWANRDRSVLGAVSDARVWAPVLVLGAFVLIAAVVNFERWGNPLKFADFRYYDYAHRQARRLAVIVGQGELSPSRIPVSILYYATGIPYLLKGVSPFSDYLWAHFDGIEAPPMTGVVANPLTIILAGFGFWRLVRRPPARAAALWLVLAGHATAMVLVFSAMNLAMRYRLDFAPFMMLAAFIGYPVLSAVTTVRRSLLAVSVVLCLGGVLSSHYLLVIHKVWNAGVPRDVRLDLLPYAPFARAALEQ